jgi:hypothetical protein
MSCIFRTLERLSPKYGVQGLSEEAHLEALAKRGGTSLAASLGFLVIFLLATFAALILLEFFLKGA